jgi:hypothetical protein
MPGWDDEIFGNLPPGYQGMPSSPNVEDRRAAGANNWNVDVPQSAPLDLNAQILSQYPPGTRAYSLDQYRWLQANMPQNPPTTPLPDPSFSLDPSILARIKQTPWPSPYWMQPATIPGGPRSGPRLAGMTINSNPLTGR